MDSDSNYIRLTTEKSVGDLPTPSTFVYGHTNMDKIWGTDLWHYMTT